VGEHSRPPYADELMGRGPRIQCIRRVGGHQWGSGFSRSVRVFAGHAGCVLTTGKPRLMTRMPNNPDTLGCDYLMVAKARIDARREPMEWVLAISSSVAQGSEFTDSAGDYAPLSDVYRELMRGAL